MRKKTSSSTNFSQTTSTQLPNQIARTKTNIFPIRRNLPSNEDIAYYSMLFFFNLNSLYISSSLRKTPNFLRIFNNNARSPKRTRYVIVNHDVDRPDRKIRVNAFANCWRMNELEFPGFVFSPGLMKIRKERKKEGNARGIITW